MFGSFILRWLIQGSGRNGICRVLATLEAIVLKVGSFPGSVSTLPFASRQLLPYTFVPQLFDLLYTPFATTSVASIMPSSKFTEILDPELHSTSPKSDVRLEDILAASDNTRGRTSSDTSSKSNSSTSSRPNSGERVDQKSKQRLSRLLSIAKR